MSNEMNETANVRGPQFRPVHSTKLENFKLSARWLTDAIDQSGPQRRHFDGRQRGGRGPVGGRSDHGRRLSHTLVPVAPLLFGVGIVGAGVGLGVAVRPAEALEGAAAAAATPHRRRLVVRPVRRPLARRRFLPMMRQFGCRPRGLTDGRHFHAPPPSAPFFSSSYFFHAVLGIFGRNILFQFYSIFLG